MAAESPAHFFSIIMLRVQLRRLRIPDQFVSKHGDVLPDHVYLQAPGGEMWPVELVKREGEILLGKGWAGFAAHYSIRICQFVVFRYDWSSCFHVIIFNVGATEIDHPGNILRHMKNVEHRDLSVTHEFVSDDDEEDSPSIEILEEYPPGYSKKAEQGTLSALVDDQYVETVQALSSEKTKRCGSRKIEVKRKKVVPVPKNGAKQKVLERAAAFKSKNPHFFLRMSSSYICTDYLYIPTSHSRAFFDYTKGEKNVLLRRSKDGEIKTWIVRCGFGNSRSIHSFKRMRFYSGWLDFVRDNKLQVGDVCIFELTDTVETLYEVSLYHANGNYNDDCKVDSESKEEEDDSSSIQILEDYTSACLKKTEQKTKTTFSDDQSVGARQIVVGIKAKQCGSEKGQVKRKRVLPVLQGDIKQKVLQGVIKQKVLHRAATFKSRNPHFFIGMSPTYIRANYLYIPSSHSTTYFKPEKGEKNVALHRFQDGEMKTWTVGYANVDIRPMHKQVCFRSGWRDFVRENKLQVGDVCIFELTDPVAMSYKVSVVRVNGCQDDDWSVLKCDSRASSSQVDDGSSHQPWKRLKKEPASGGKQQNGKSMRTSSSCMSSIQKKNRIILKLKNDFKSRNPYFAISMQPSYLSGGNVHIPLSHSITYFSKMTKDSNAITLYVKETSKRWNVGCTTTQDNSVKLNSGWIRFVVDNGLKVGDACIFELVDVRDKVYRVTIFQGVVS